MHIPMPGVVIGQQAKNFDGKRKALIAGYLPGTKFTDSGGIG
jgi:hypothetical protein